MKTAVYARVSTNNGQNPEMQLRELQGILRKAWLGVTRDTSIPEYPVQEKNDRNSID